METYRAEKVLCLASKKMKRIKYGLLNVYVNKQGSINVDDLRVGTSLSIRIRNAHHISMMFSK